MTRDKITWAGRAGLVAKGVPYLAIAWLALDVAFGKRGRTADRRSRTATGKSGRTRRGVCETADAFELPLGRELVFCVGVGFAGAAAYNFWRAVTRNFMDDMRTSNAWVESLGVVGHAARGVVWAIVA